MPARLVGFSVTFLLARVAVLLVAMCLSGLVGAQTTPMASSPRLPIAVMQRTVDSLNAASASAKSRARAYQALGGGHEAAQDQSSAVAAYERAIPLALASRDSLTLADAQHALGLLHWRRNNFDRALTYLTPALSVRLALGDRLGAARVFGTRGSAHYQLGEYEPALNDFVQSLAIRREAGDSAGVARILTNLGKTYHDWNQLTRAQRMFEEAVAAAEGVNDAVTLGYALNSLAMLSVDRKDFAAARRFVARSESAYNGPDVSRLPLDSLSIWSLNTTASALILMREGRAVEALPMLEAVRGAGAAGGDTRVQARALLYLGEAYGALGNRTAAKVALERSLGFARMVRQRVMILDALLQLAELEEGAGNAVAALRNLRAYQALRDSIFDQSTAQRLAAMEANAVTVREQQENARLREAQRLQSLTIERQRTVGALGAVILLLAATVVALLVYFNRQGRMREAVLASVNADTAATNLNLRNALAEVQTLSGLIPICASCKMVRNDKGYWDTVETYISSRSQATFSHSICQSCGPKLYGDLWPSESESNMP